MRIVVKDTNVIERTVPIKGVNQIFRSQRAALDLGGGYELPFQVGLGSGAVHPVGDYQLDPQCFGLNQYGDLTMGRVKLLPATARPLSAAKAG